eukprot:TRINITY_DN31786_c0_g1_i1.p1 TRINITY_DN31786_c0_g1~~TRINITY_DN31786_c0_g1_i1.p1  ORF type:complete len:113 (+),score=36.14 TRINITY_DN31786_c0_g1_i1:162-500(+)
MSVQFLASSLYQEPGSILSGGTVCSKDSFDEDRSVTCMDIKLIMPTVLILIFTLFVMVTVIPYAFSSVIKQLQGVWALEEQMEAEAALHAANEAAGLTNPQELVEETTACSC